MNSCSARTHTHDKSKLLIFAIVRIAHTHHHHQQINFDRRQIKEKERKKIKLFYTSSEQGIYSYTYLAFTIHNHHSSFISIRSATGEGREHGTMYNFQKEDISFVFVVHFS